MTRLVRSLFWKAFGATYFIAFTSLRAQVLGLYGERGILPVKDFLEHTKRRRRRPSLLWLDASDGGLVRLCELGQTCAVLLGAGVAPRLMTAALWAIYLSFVSVGREFLAYQWDALLLESSPCAILAAARDDEDTPWPAVLLMRWLVFRLYFESGLSKLASHDPTWRDCTACAHHYQTQPLPTPWSWNSHQLPKVIHRLSTLLTLAIECGAPVLAFAPRRPRRLGFAILTSLQLLIAATGNYGFFNLLTGALGLWLLDDQVLSRKPARLRRAPWWRRWASFAAGLPLAALTSTSFLFRFKLIGKLPRPIVRLHQIAAPFHSANSYGLFAVMTTRRPEIVIEGSNDGIHWREYQLRYKPGATNRSPRFVAPHQPRLDWQMWFAALGPPPAWFESFLLRLLQGSPEVLRLLGSNPFPDRPPLMVRALLYDYAFTDRETRKRTGAWWQRQLLGLYFPPCSLPGVSP
jgi:hypothetical protein